MKSGIIPHLYVKFWSSPLIVRKLLSPICKYLYLRSNNSRCVENIKQITDVCNKWRIELSPTLKKDIIGCFILYGISPLEYFLFRFSKRKDKQRDEFLSDAYRTQIQKDIIGLNLFQSDLINKYNFYIKNQPYFKRECIKLTSSTTYDEFKNFIQRHGVVFLKVNAGSFGFNAHTVKFQDESSLRNEFNSLNLSSGVEWIAEELVVQDEKLAVWNKSSVNTIRIPSFLLDNGTKWEIYQPFIRTGRKGAVVDNAGAGGIFAVIDKKSGRIITDGADENFNRYEIHPDSNIKYKGWQVPKWEELLVVVEKAHKGMPNHKYIAYDFALTDNGWVMIEGNWGQYLCQQTATQKGCKKDFIALLKN